MSEDFTKWAREIFTASASGHVLCERHLYGGSATQPPAEGCRACWMIYITKILADTPPQFREERLSQILKIVRDTAQIADKANGESIPNLFSTPKVEITKE